MSYFDELDRIWGKAGSDSNQHLRDRIRPRQTRRWLIAVGSLIALFILASIGRGIYTEWLWFDSLGFSNVYSTILTTKVWLFFAGALFSLGLLLANLFLVRRLSPPSRGGGPIGQGLLFVRRAVDMVILGVAAFISLIFGLVTSSQWEMVLRFTHAADFNVV